MSPIEWISLLRDVGLPAVIIYWLFTEGSRNNRRMSKDLDGIRQELKNLTIALHDVLAIAKSKGVF